MQITSVSLDLAKCIFPVFCFDGCNPETGQRMQRRRLVLTHFGQLQFDGHERLRCLALPGAGAGEQNGALGLVVLHNETV